MIVYRLEKNGKGPFYGELKGHFYDPFDDVTDNDIRRLKDNITYTWYTWESASDFLFGCNTLKKLQDYFGGFWRPAIHAGYRVKRYYVDKRDVRHSNYIELAFRKDGTFHEVPNYEKYE